MVRQESDTVDLVYRLFHLYILAPGQLLQKLPNFAPKRNLAFFGAASDLAIIQTVSIRYRTDNQYGITGMIQQSQYRSVFEFLFS